MRLTRGHAGRQVAAPQTTPTLHARGPCDTIRKMGVLLAVVGGVFFAVSPAGADDSRPFEQRVHAAKQAVIDFHKTLFTSTEEAAVPAPHVDILFQIDARGKSPHPHHLPSWIRIALDRLPPVEHSYPDVERHALAQGGLQSLLSAPFSPGRHTLGVTLKGIDRTGKSYLKTKEFDFETQGPAAHILLQFRAEVNEDPRVTLEQLGESLLAVPPVEGNHSYRLGLFASIAGDYGGAASFFLASLDRNERGHRAESRLRLAEAYAAVGLPEEAEAVLGALIGQTADAALRARAWFTIEQLAFRGERYARAIEAYERIGFDRFDATPAQHPPTVALASDAVDEAHILAGTSALALRDYPRAAALLRRVAKQGPESAFALYGQAQALSGLGDAFTAVELFRRLIQSRSLFDPVRSRVIESAQAALGFQLLEQGRYEEALSQFGPIRADHPAYQTALFGVGWALRKMGEHIKAIAIFQDLLARFPQGEHAHEARLAIAACYADLKAYTRAVKAHHTALDGLTAAVHQLDRRKTAIGASQWDPLAEPASEAREHWHEQGEWSRQVEGYRWLLTFERLLRRTLDRFPPYLSAGRRPDCPSPPCAGTPGTRLQGTEGARLVARGQDLLATLEAVKTEYRRVLARHALERVAREQARLDEWSVQASLGIARNLVAERDELGSEVLTLD